MTKTTAKLQNIEKLTETVGEYRFMLGESIDFLPGQYVILRFGEKIRRPYSIVALEGKELVLIIDTKPMGEASKYILDMLVGEEVNVMGAMGDFVLVDTPNPKVFVSAGTGIAPMIAMLNTLSREKFGGRVIVLWGTRNDKDIYLDRYVGNLELDLKVVPCVSRPSDKYDGYNGRVTSAIKELDLRIDWSHADCYICGRKEVIKDSIEVLKEKGAVKIYSERY